VLSTDDESRLNGLSYQLQVIESIRQATYNDKHNEVNETPYHVERFDASPTSGEILYRVLRYATICALTAPAVAPGLRLARLFSS
jgi:hypothetical protein